MSIKNFSRASIIATYLLTISICFNFVNLPCYAKSKALDKPANNNQLGRDTYEIACINCHDPTLAPGIGAPRAFDKTAWATRFKIAKKAAKAYPDRYPTAMDYLLYQVKVGKGLMHHGGLCLEANVPDKNCSDAAYIAAIQYMSRPKPK